MSFRNRCTLLGPNGLINLTVPLLGGREQKCPVNEILVDNRDNWQVRHFRTLESCYSRSPWFDHYRDELRELYAARPLRLLEWNLLCFRWIYDKLSLTVQLELNDQYDPDPPVDEYVDLRNVIRPATIATLFPQPAEYPQVFSDRFSFVPTLSILDYLFCAGNKLEGRS